ncbi:hypothetical protein AB4090_07835 [Acidithiobacillus sp. IBUN Pt1247-S3]
MGSNAHHTAAAMVKPRSEDAVDEIASDPEARTHHEGLPEPGVSPTSV